MKEIIYIIFVFLFVSFLILFTVCLCIISKKSDESLNPIENLINSNKRNTKNFRLNFNEEKLLKQKENCLK